MAAKKASLAKEAAAKATKKKKASSTEASAPPGIWTRKMVEQALLAFNDLKAVPAHDEDGVNALVDSYYGFVDVVARGDVEVEALSLASELIRLGHDWLEKNPRYIRINSDVWDKQLVENTILWFGSVRDDKSKVKDTVARFAAFERVWRSGHVAEGEARWLAQALVEHGRDWINSNADAQKAYDAL